LHEERLIIVSINNKKISKRYKVWFVWNGRLAANIHSGRSSYRRGTTLEELKVLPEPAKELERAVAVLDVGERSHSRPSRFTPGENETGTR
jgi:hypothetical protein